MLAEIKNENQDLFNYEKNPILAQFVGEYYKNQWKSISTNEKFCLGDIEREIRSKDNYFMVLKGLGLVLAAGVAVPMVIVAAPIVASISTAIATSVSAVATTENVVAAGAIGVKVMTNKLLGKA